MSKPKSILTYINAGSTDSENVFFLAFAYSRWNQDSLLTKEYRDIIQFSLNEPAHVSVKKLRDTADRIEKGCIKDKP